MRRVISSNIMTLDGCFEGPTKWSLDWHEIGWGEELERFSLEQGSTADLLLFGRVTYEGMAAHWQQAAGAIADFMNATAKVVFSRTLERADWNNTRLVQGDAADEVARLRREPGKDILIFGSAEIHDALMQRDLIDEYRIVLFPLVLGDGAPLFKPGRDRVRMKLLEARTLATGCQLLRYEPFSRTRPA
jgi:dihydrofolate reductase